MQNSSLSIRRAGPSSSMLSTMPCDLCQSDPTQTVCSAAIKSSVCRHLWLSSACKSKALLQAFSLKRCTASSCSAWSALLPMKSSQSAQWSCSLMEKKTLEHADRLLALPFQSETLAARSSLKPGFALALHFAHAEKRQAVNTPHVEETV